MLGDEGRSLWGRGDSRHAETKLRRAVAASTGMQLQQAVKPQYTTLYSSFASLS
jgi:hypothetical protein